MRDGIYSSELSPDDWRAVDRLVEACRANDGLEIPIHQFPHRREQEVNQFLYFDSDELVGIATIPPGPEIEVLGAVRPDRRMRGIGRRLLIAVEAECRSRQATNYLLVCESASRSGCAFAERFGGVYEFSEHLMEFDWNEVGDLLQAKMIDLQPAQIGDIEDLVDARRGTQTDFEQSRREIEGWLHSDAHQVLVVHREGHAVGMIRVTRRKDVVWLNSFTIHESFRGKGIGRLMLANVVRTQEQGQRILLEVETDNEPALDLYRSSGFHERTTYRYYRHASQANLER